MCERFRDAKALCTKSRLPASDYVINPYVGCLHRCRYCYASFMGRFTNHTEPWGTYIEPKRFASYRLPRNLKGKTILVGSVTDAYNPAERQYRLMPDILRALASSQAHVEILTKSSLVLRDMELIRQIPDAAVSVSLSNLNGDDNALLEPGADTAEQRLHTLKVLSENGIPTYLFVAPYLPGLTDLPLLCRRAGRYVRYVCVENLNLRGGSRKTVLGIIRGRHPDLYPLYEQIYLKKQGAAYWEALERSFPQIEQSCQVPIVSYLYHEKIKKGGKTDD